MQHRRISRIVSANLPSHPFPIENLPFGVYQVPGQPARVCTAIGDYILDLALLEGAGLLKRSATARVFERETLNDFMALGRDVRKRTRAELISLLAADTKLPETDQGILQRALVPQSADKMKMPFAVSGFTDFYSSREHATNMGSLLRDPAKALMPNWLHMPVGYNGRASTVVVSGTDIIRPRGQLMSPGAQVPEFGPSRKLDYELEIGAVVGSATGMGRPVSTRDAYDMIFGYVLLNDWSARDIQAWEYQPLGPFLGKAFATTISPWIVTVDAVEPFRVSTPERVVPLLPYLHEDEPYNYDLHLEIEITPGGAPEGQVVSKTNQRHMYYSSPQQIAHHTSSGCNMRVGDLLGSGTISGSSRDSLGSLVELTRNGAQPLSLSDGVNRSFLEDGDRVTFSGWCERDGYRIGFGTCTGTILPPFLSKGDL